MEHTTVHILANKMRSALSTHPSIIDIYIFAERQVLLFSLVFPTVNFYPRTHSMKSVVAGWRPRRSIVLCSWGGEEYGLLGSTEWVEVCSC